jgi:hypothetical protein
MTIESTFPSSNLNVMGQAYGRTKLGYHPAKYRRTSLLTGSMVAGPSMAVLRDNIGAAAVLWDIVGL